MYVISEKFKHILLQRFFLVFTPFCIVCILKTLNIRWKLTQLGCKLNILSLLYKCDNYEKIPTTILFE